MSHGTVSKTEGSLHEKIKKSRKSSSLFSDSRGVVNKEFVPPGVTVNQRYYLEILDRLRKRVMRLRMEIADDWILRAS
jgi:hypothetical protein